MGFGQLKDTFIIAEIGGNHEGDLDYAIRLTELAAEAGADAVKFQSYSPEGMVSKVEDPARYEHFGKFSLEVEEYIELAKLCKSLDVEFMSSIWDADYLEALDPYINFHKVGSGDLTNYPLLKKILARKKPVILSTAMADLQEIKATVDFALSVQPDCIGLGNLALLHCVAMYGEPLDEYANLRAIGTLGDEFPEIPIGYSDHTLGFHAASIAVGMGAKILELHFTDDKTRAFRDHHLSVDKDEMMSLVKSIKRTEELLGTQIIEPVSGIETKERIVEFRRACYFTEDMSPGQVITEENLTTLRPNRGIDARNYFDLIGKKLLRPVAAFHALSNDDIDDL